MHVFSVMAQANPQGAAARPPTDIIVWVIALILLLLAGAMGIMMMRRALFSPDKGAGETGLMDSLRAMRDRGQISEAEYDAMRKSMVRKAASAAGIGAQANGTRAGTSRSGGEAPGKG